MRLSFFAGLALLIHFCLAFALFGLNLFSPKPLAGGEVSVEIGLKRGDLLPAPSRKLSQPRSTAASDNERGEGAGSGESAGDEPTAGSADETEAGRAANQLGSGVEGTDPLLARIRSRIEAATRYPLLAEKMRVQGKVGISFRIDGTGRPADLKIENSSGSAILDNEALATVKRSGPLPRYEKSLSVWINFAPEKS